MMASTGTKPSGNRPKRLDEPWSAAETARLVEAVVALIASHRSIDLPSPLPKRKPTILSVVDGAALWALMSALDRTEESSGV